MALGAAAALVSVNIWTGAPLLALWVGSLVVPETGLTLGTVFVIVAVLSLSVVGLAFALTRLTAAYDELTGRPARLRRTSPWLRSVRGERDSWRRLGIVSSPLERIVMASVVACALAFEVWFFFFARYHWPGL